MFDYKGIVNNAKVYGYFNGFMPKDNHYRDICEWAKTLSENYRINLGTHMAILKELHDDKDYNVMFEYYYSTKLILVYFPHKHCSNIW